jgi:ABC-type multidrug transport system fused ATPase/permease subunit
MTASKLV